MSDALQIGQISRLADGRHQGKMTHVYEGHSAAAIWAMLTEPGNIAQWIAPGSIELKVGGAVAIDFQDSGFAIRSQVLALEPGKLLEYSWSQGDEPARPLRWEVEEVNGHGTLTLTVTVPAGEDAAKACAGFEAHLAMLAGALEGVPMKFPFQLFLDARKAYSQQLA